MGEGGVHVGLKNLPHQRLAAGHILPDGLAPAIRDVANQHGGDPEPGPDRRSTSTAISCLKAAQRLTPVGWRGPALLPGPTSQDHIPCRHGGSRQRLRCDGRHRRASTVAIACTKHGRSGRVVQTPHTVPTRCKRRTQRPAIAGSRTSDARHQRCPATHSNPPAGRAIRSTPMRQPIVVEEHPRLLRAPGCSNTEPGSVTISSVIRSDQKARVRRNHRGSAMAIPELTAEPPAQRARATADASRPADAVSSPPRTNAGSSGQAVSPVREPSSW